MKVRVVAGLAVVCMSVSCVILSAAIAAVPLPPVTSALSLGVTSREGQLGTTMASSGDFLVVGSPAKLTSQSGELLLFKKPPSGNWRRTKPLAELTLSRGLPSAHLGVSVAMSGRTIVTSDPFRAVNGHEVQGAVYVFTEPKNGWHSETQAATLTVPNEAEFEYLGLHLAVSGNTIVASMRTSAGLSQLATFTRGAGGWADARTAVLSAGPHESKWFGESIAVSGSTVVASSPASGALSRARVYVFQRPTVGWRTTTVPSATLHGDSRTTEQIDGATVAVFGNTIVAAAQLEAHPAGKDHSVIYVFSRPPGGWSNAGPTATLNDTVMNESDELGESLAISRAGILAGDPDFKTLSGKRPGADFWFAKPKTGWRNGSATSMVLPAGQPDNALFGSSVSLVNGEAITGAPHVGARGVGSPFSGRVYFARLVY